TARSPGWKPGRVLQVDPPDAGARRREEVAAIPAEGEVGHRAEAVAPELGPGRAAVGAGLDDPAGQPSPDTVGCARVVGEAADRRSARDRQHGVPGRAVVVAAEELATARRSGEVRADVQPRGRRPAAADEARRVKPD